MESISWPHTWTDDNRTGVALSSSRLASSLSADYPELAFHMLSAFFWVEILAFIILGLGISAVVGSLLFMTLQRFTLRGPNSTARFLIGYGIFCAGWIILPKPAADMLGLRNKIFRFCFCLLSPITSLFKTTAAIHGFVPASALQSVRSFATYYASPMTLLHNPKTLDPIRPTFGDLLRSLLRFFGLIFVTGGFQSLFFWLSWFPAFGAPDIADDWYDMARLWNVRSWKDTLLYAVLFQLYLMTFGEGLLLFTQVVVGVKAQPIMDNPILQASSPSDFWGRRWNLVIHNCLKEGVYKPIRQSGGSPAVAVTGAFFASGLFHEWLIPVVFTDMNGYQPRPGYTLLFFSWNAVLVCMEGVLCNNKWFVRTAHRIPKPVRTLLVLLLALPVGHLFCDPYVRSDFFHQGGFAFPMLLPSR
jgi:Membrane bound O-acyl transferase family